MRAVVGGEELMVRVEVRYDDYIRVRRRLCTTELQRSTSVDSLSATPLPPKDTGSRSLLNSLDLVTTRTHDSSFADWATDTNTKQLVLKMKQKSQALTVLAAKHEIAQRQVELQEGMVRGLQREVTRVTQEQETAQKVLTDKGKEIEALTGANKGMKDTIDELLAEKTKLTNKLAMMERDAKLKDDKMESFQRDVTRLTWEKETAQIVLTDNKKEIEDLTEANKGMKDTIDELLAEKTKLTKKREMIEKQSQEETSPEVPEAPDRLEAIETGNYAIKLRWTPVSSTHHQLNGYMLERSVAFQDRWTLAHAPLSVLPVTTTDFSVDVQPYKGYSFRVKSAIINKGKLLVSDGCRLEDVVAREQYQPYPPRNLMVENVMQDSVSLLWMEPVPADDVNPAHYEYVIEKCHDVDNLLTTWQECLRTTECKGTVKVQQEGTYCFRVSALNKDKNVSSLPTALGRKSWIFIYEI
ncbi:titin-like [Branchiostoma floridae]|uniref:Titin-like n=1 Tax=Branchiostoma floridae TaxID=7739 RepID=A0A9J7KIR6_BRAFL|nr:titin-like [Branchiostoma floridae]